MKGIGWLIAGVILIILGAGGLIAMPDIASNDKKYGFDRSPGWDRQHPFERAPMMPSWMRKTAKLMTKDFSKTEYKSEGERIYLTGTNKSGRAIAYRMIGHGMMKRMRGNNTLGCANCHGLDGRGGLRFPDGSRSADIRWNSLTGEQYDRTTLFGAITQGEEPDGDELGPFMPRWLMSRDEFDSLYEYLQQLK